MGTYRALTSAVGPCMECDRSPGPDDKLPYSEVIEILVKDAPTYRLCPACLRRFVGWLKDEVMVQDAIEEAETRAGIGPELSELTKNEGATGYGEDVP
jgi:hypothetical protein